MKLLKWTILVFCISFLVFCIAFTIAKVIQPIDIAKYEESNRKVVSEVLEEFKMSVGLCVDASE